MFVEIFVLRRGVLLEGAGLLVHEKEFLVQIKAQAVGPPQRAFVKDLAVLPKTRVEELRGAGHGKARSGARNAFRETETDRDHRAKDQKKREFFALFDDKEKRRQAKDEQGQQGDRRHVVRSNAIPRRGCCRRRLDRNGAKRSKPSRRKRHQPGARGRYRRCEMTATFVPTRKPRREQRAAERRERNEPGDLR